MPLNTHSWRCTRVRRSSGDNRQKWLLQGDANTAYFHAIANGRRRKCTIPCLWDGDFLLEEAREISAHIYSFYKELFEAGPRTGVALAEDLWPARTWVSEAENAELTLPFLAPEVRETVMGDTSPTYR
jgi:hypothetical protein